MNPMLKSRIYSLKFIILTFAVSLTPLTYAKECRPIDKMKDNEMIKVLTVSPPENESSEPKCIQKTKKAVLDEINIVNQEEINLSLELSTHLLNPSKCQTQPILTQFNSKQSSSFGLEIPISDYLNESDAYLKKYQFMNLKSLQQDWNEGIQKVEKVVESVKLDKYNRYPNDFHEKIFNLKDKFEKTIEKAGHNAVKHLSQLYTSLKHKMNPARTKSVAVAPIDNTSAEADFDENYLSKPKIESLIPADATPLRYAKFGLGLTEAGFGAVAIVFPAINLAAGSFSMLDTIAEGLLPSNKVGPEHPVFHEFEANRDPSTSRLGARKPGIKKTRLEQSIKKITPLVSESTSFSTVKFHLPSIHTFAFIPVELMTSMVPFLNGSAIMLKGFSKMYKAVTEPENGIEVIKAYTALHEKIVKKAISQNNQSLKNLMLQGASMIQQPNNGLKPEDKYQIYSKLNCLCNANDYFSNLTKKSEQSFAKRYKYLDNILSAQKKRDKLKDNLLKIVKQDQDSLDKAGWIKIISHFDQLNSENQQSVDKYQKYFNSIPTHTQSVEAVENYQKALNNFNSLKWNPDPNQTTGFSSQKGGNFKLEATTKRERLNRQIDAIFEMENSIQKLIQAHLDFSVKSAEAAPSKPETSKEKQTSNFRLSSPVYTHEGEIRVRSTHEQTEKETHHFRTKIREKLEQIEHHFKKIRPEKSPANDINNSSSNSSLSTEPSD